MGISLGGHAAWQVLFADPRVTAGVVIIGCPDYMRKFDIAYLLPCSHSMEKTAHQNPQAVPKQVATSELSLKNDVWIF
jgi:dienelactone hydrolase